MNSGSGSGSMFSVNKDGLIGNADPQVDYVEIDPMGRYVRVHSFSFPTLLLCCTYFIINILLLFHVANVLYLAINLHT